MSRAWRTLRNVAKLVVVDISGSIGPVGPCAKHMDYVEGKWGTFNYVVVVMDGK